MTSMQEMTLEQAADFVASRLHGNVKTAGVGSIAGKLVARSGLRHGLEAGKGAVQNFDPVLNTGHSTLLGAGLGGGLGAVGALTSADKEKRKHWLRHGLFGGAMGGVGGAAFGAGREGLTGIIEATKRELEAANKPVPTGFLTGGAEHVRRGLGELVDLAGGGIVGDTAKRFTESHPGHLIVGGGLAGGLLNTGIRYRQDYNMWRNAIARMLSDNTDGKATKMLADLNERFKQHGIKPITDKQVTALTAPRNPLIKAVKGIPTNIYRTLANQVTKVQNHFGETNAPKYGPAFKPKPMREMVPAMPNWLGIPQRAGLRLKVDQSKMKSPHGIMSKPSVGAAFGAGLGALIGMYGRPELTPQQQSYLDRTAPSL